ncbi:hypothetical protein [Streptomyces rubiginosohelvolus]|uniref:hypothetical protein n=1 Tax=Streptomyces rubiginosohelvolus TaxID=67362 RepID=UPI00365F9ABF
MEAEPERRQHDTIPARLAQEMDSDELSQLVRQANDSGVTYQAMADRSAEAGHPLSKPFFQKLGTNAAATVKGESLPGVAAGLELPLQMVRAAAAKQFLDYEARELGGFSDDVRVVVSHLAGMSPEEIRRWRAMIEADERERSRRLE